MGRSIEAVDTRSAPKALLEEMYEYYAPVYAEELPDDEPVPFERQELDWRHLPENSSVPRWLLREDGEIVGVGVAWLELDQNLDNAFARIHVRQDRRRRGYAKRLAAPILEMLEDDGRKRVNTYAVEGRPEEALFERLGLKPAYREKRSRLVMAEVDMDLMQAWVARAQERAADYELLSVRVPFPEGVVEPYCDLQFQMNTAPQEDFEQDNWVLTPAMWLDQETKLDLSQKDLHTLVAVHSGTGEYVGSTSIQTDRLHPEQGWQWETVVHPDHRNKGLGRWLKGGLIQRIASEYPVLERVDTWNAGSNEPMLNINVAMGFKPIVITMAWQGDLPEARRRLLG